jgi:aerobic C4-dicarboxylate transport protein
MSEARALTNLMGNAVATIVVSRWERALDAPQAKAALGGAPMVGVGQAAAEPAQKAPTAPAE